jgi:hypothetical protein
MTNGIGIWFAPDYDQEEIGAEKMPVPNPDFASHGCKRAGGFVDISCTAVCDCHKTLALSGAVQKEIDRGKRHGFPGYQEGLTYGDGYAAGLAAGVSLSE